jgi:aconitate hydratase
MLPFQMEKEPEFQVGDYIYVPGIRKALDGDLKDIAAYVIKGGKEALAAKDACVKELRLYMADMTAEEREIVKAGCLINYNRNRQKG